MTDNERSYKTILKVSDALFSTMGLLFGAQLFVSGGNEKHSLVGLILFTVLGLSNVFGALAADKAKIPDRYGHLLNAAVYVFCALVFFFMRGSVAAVRTIAFAYFFVIIVNRLLAVVLDPNSRKARGIALNAAIIVIMALVVGYFVLVDERLHELNVKIIAVVIAVRSFLHIIVTSFSRIRFSTLTKVVRKTYAFEILFGLLMLIFAFSIVFWVVEPDMTSIPSALWYCFSIVTTIGFGDVTATTALGRALSVMLGVYGLIVVALLTSIIVNFYNEVKDENAARNDNGPTDPETPAAVLAREASRRAEKPRGNVAEKDCMPASVKNKLKK